MLHWLLHHAPGRNAFAYGGAATRQIQTQPSLTSSQGQLDIRSWLKSDLKAAMKARNSMASTVIRSVLAEVTNLEKAKGASTVSDAAVYGVIRRAVARRQEAGAHFKEASRLDLAEKEDSEASLLTQFLPPPLTAEEVEKFLSNAVSSVVASPSSQIWAHGGNGGKNIQALVGKSLKTFWANAPPGHFGTVPSEELSTLARILIEAKLR